ncbi:MAG: MscL family protein [Chthoniobacterales bacterium]
MENFAGIFLEGYAPSQPLFLSSRVAAMTEHRPPGKPASSLKDATDKGLAVIGYGAFLNTVIEFVIIAFVIFLIIKQINLLVKPAPVPPKGPSAEEKLLTEIRDILKAQS